MPTLSIIIPVYDVEKYLRRCVGSVTEQPFSDWEIILVDDGSPDNCPAICDSMAESDGRITVIHRQNGGLSAARNSGIEAAAGRYITFIDSDDTIAPDTLGPLIGMLSAHPEYDILEYSIHQDYGSPGGGTMHRLEERTYTSFRDYWQDSRGYEHCWSCNKIFRRTLLNGNSFAVGKYYEDVLLMGSLIDRRPVIHTTSLGLYVYRYNSNGISKGYDTRLLQLLEAQQDIVATLAIDLRRPQWHRLYMRLLNIQIDIYRITGRVLLPEVKVCVKPYFGMTSLVKSVMLRILGLHKTLIILARR